ncbi:glycosyltransferase family 4 protein [Kineosporia sp. A_224]|uniref:glycosyltransferase family 4 protein n=1 Tax=Kineosporia sp. A_224 TaxID=1962180 RepID=UPI000B4B2CDF
MVTFASSVLRLPSRWRHYVQCVALDLEILTRLVLRCGKFRGAIFHWNNNCLVASPTFARAIGMHLILDYRALHPRVEHPLGAPMNWADLREIRMADVILVNSHLASRTFVSQGVSLERVVVVPLGFDRAEWTALPHVARATRRVLFVGAIAGRKGLLDLVDAASRLPDDIEWVFAGPSPEPEVSTALRAAFPRCQFLGPLSKRELVQQYSQATVLVLPSRQEAFGLVVLEALACGSRVVVSDGCGASAIVASNPDFGRVFPAGDSEELGRALVEECGAHVNVLGRSEALKSWTWDGYEDRLRDAYAEILEAMCPSRNCQSAEFSGH